VSLFFGFQNSSLSM